MMERTCAGQEDHGFESRSTEGDPEIYSDEHPVTVAVNAKGMLIAVTLHLEVLSVCLSCCIAFVLEG